MIDPGISRDPRNAPIDVAHPEPRPPRGRLKIFLGMCAGVGKTYAMLEAGRVRGIEGIDIIGGVIETHGRGETEALLLGHELLPLKQIAYRGINLEEFDIDACLTRRPALVLIDELAHTNAPGARHEKRWQDVQELLAAGISVYTSLNIQHIESLCDVVARITGVVIRETVPDSLIETADEIELVDLNPEELLTRMAEGKVYLTGQAQMAADRFFRIQNLIALREMALRYVAERVDRQMMAARSTGGFGAAQGIWPVRERLLVCVTPAPQSARLVRATRRLAGQLHAEWHAVHVELRPDAASTKDHDRLHRILRLAEQLGAKTATLDGTNLADDLVAYARQHNVTKIVLGKTAQPRWRQAMRRSLADALTRRAPELDLYVISGEGQGAAAAPTVTPTDSVGPRSWRSLLTSVLIVGATTGMCALLRQGLGFSPTNLAMVYLASVVLTSLRGERWLAVATSILSVAAFDFFFVPPHLTFAVEDLQYLTTFAVMLAVALLISGLTVRARQQAMAARRRASRTGAQLDFTRAIGEAAEPNAVLKTAVQHLAALFESGVVIHLTGSNGKLEYAGGDDRLGAVEREQAVAAWVVANAQPAGLGTATLPASTCLYVPMTSGGRVLGALGMQPARTSRFADPQELHLLSAMADQIAMALERLRLSDQAGQSQVQAETERTRSALLSSISHDFRTPLATILGSAENLQNAALMHDEAARRELARGIADEARRLDRLVCNLLDMTRLESGGIHLRRDWQSIEELVGAALARLRPQLGNRPVATRLAGNLPLIAIDGALVEQALVNLLDNACKYTPADSPIDIEAELDADAIRIRILDRGPGIASQDVPHIFEKFQRGSRPTGEGSGLGLAICEAIVRAHGGRITAEARPGGGAVLSFTLPLLGEPPTMDVPPERPHSP